MNADVWVQNLGGVYDLKPKNLTQWWGLMIPFAIQDFMIPLGLALAPFGKGCRAVIEPDLIVPLCMIICKSNYIIMTSEVNIF